MARFCHRDLDGTWARLLDDGTLELRDPNSGQDADPASKPRHQYRVEYYLLLRRVLPPPSVGDRWADDDIDDPWWEPVLTLPPAPSSILRDYWEACTQVPDPGAGMGAPGSAGYDLAARYAAGHVALYTPTGREVRYDQQRGGYEVQPRNDNYWIHVPDLPAARRAFFARGEGS